MNAFLKQHFSDFISLAVMLLMVVAIVHGQVLVRTTAIAGAPAAGFGSAAVESGLER